MVSALHPDTFSSWLNMVGSRFKLLTERRLRHGAITSVNHLVETIEVWIEH